MFHLKHVDVAATRNELQGSICVWVCVFVCACVAIIEKYHREIRKGSKKDQRKLRSERCKKEWQRKEEWKKMWFQEREIYDIFVCMYLSLCWWGGGMEQRERE